MSQFHQGIRSDITRKVFEQAAHAFEAGADHKFGPSTFCDLANEGKRYPPKATIIGLAANLSQPSHSTPHKPEPSFGFDRCAHQSCETELCSSGGILDSAVEFLRPNPSPHSRAGILSVLNLTPGHWPPLRDALTSHSQIQTIGQKRGTRYEWASNGGSE